MKKLLIFVALLALILTAAGATTIDVYAHAKPAQNLSLTAKSAYLVDYNTGTVMFEQNPDEKRPIASMVKIMTLNLAFEAVERGVLAFDQKIQISQTAQSMGGSQMFIQAGDEYTVSELIKGVVICSANDASVALAEAICGSVEEFVAMMNARAAEYGMTNTVFANATGLPGGTQHSTARDVSIMTRRLLAHKEYYDYSNIYMENYTHPDGRVTELVNTNKLVRFFNGCDSGKTGFTSEAKFCLSASAVRNNLRIIATVIGVEDSKTRFAEVTKLFNYAFANYENTDIISAGEMIKSDLAVANGKSRTVGIVAANSISVLTKKGEKSGFAVNVDIPEKLTAPFDKGMAAGKITVRDSNGQIVGETNIITAEAVKKIEFSDIIDKILDNWLL